MALLIAIGAALVADVALSLYGTKKLGMQEGDHLYHDKNGKLILWRLLLRDALFMGFLIYFREYTSALIVALCISVAVLVWNVIQVRKQLSDNKQYQAPSP